MHFLKQNIRNIHFLLVMLGVTFAGQAFAQVSPAVYTHKSGPGIYVRVQPENDFSEEYEEYKENEHKAGKSYIYEDITIASLSHLYWAVNYLDLANDIHIDNFMRINECDIYKSYYGSEFEWIKIRDAARTFIKGNKDFFPMRFRFVQPLELADYDMKRKAFRINPDYEIRAARRFESYAVDLDSLICKQKSFREIEGYTRGIVLELSRPFSLSYVPATPEDARAYIQEKDAIFKGLREGVKYESTRYSLRSAYIVFKVKVFAHRKKIKGSSRFDLTQMMAALEGFEIYQDKDLKKPFYIKSYLSEENEKQTSAELAAEYKILREKAKGAGVLY
tara:strand:+ start:1781 stop:2782 length:1002 start_codon:yes stop_codon:yes gene_type:complete